MDADYLLVGPPRRRRRRANSSQSGSASDNGRPARDSFIKLAARGGRAKPPSRACLLGAGGTGYWLVLISQLQWKYTPPTSVWVPPLPDWDPNTTSGSFRWVSHTHTEGKTCLQVQTLCGSPKQSQTNTGVWPALGAIVLQ